VVALVAARARSVDVVYASSMIGRTALGSALARRPFVAKLTSDPAFERARRRGLVEGETVAFQKGGGGLSASMLRVLRDWSVRHAAHVIAPSTYMAELVASWRGRLDGVTVLPNPAPDPTDAAAVELPQTRPLLAFAGRLTAAKNLDVALRALTRVARAALVVAGDGEERPRLEALAASEELNGRVHFLGAVSRGEVLGVLAAADAVVLPSRWENFPHAAVEALAMGTPVIATRVGGVPEVVRDGENGLLVNPGDVNAFAEAIERYLNDAELRERLRANAKLSVARFSVDEVYVEIERILEEAMR
jgi:glycosyltransferase involved in cell wall biosynthesis